MSTISTTDNAFQKTKARLKRPGSISTAAAAAKALAVFRSYTSLANEAYHRYQTRGPGTRTALEALGRHDAYREVAELWADALAAYLGSGHERAA